MGLEKHQKDYVAKAWHGYTIEELGKWVHLFHKRATHRTNSDKMVKDLYDAKNYLSMIEEKLKETATILKLDYDKL